MSNNKQSMKLYTEQQVRKVFLRAQTLDDNGNRLYDFFDEIKHDGDLTPIELPSDEKIDEYVKSTGYWGGWSPEYFEGIEEGAKWMRDKILGGNK